MKDDDSSGLGSEDEDEGVTETALQENLKAHLAGGQEQLPQKVTVDPKPEEAKQPPQEVPVDKKPEQANDEGEHEENGEWVDLAGEGEDEEDAEFNGEPVIAQGEPIVFGPDVSSGPVGGNE